MSAIWIAILDTSGSMNEPFSSRPSSGDPLSERGAWATKLDAAKDLLLRQVAAGRVQDVAIITFSDVASKVFHGAHADLRRAEIAVRAISAIGNTNLAAAFSLVSSDVTFEQYQALSVLLLTDGLSNRGDPVVEAQRVIAKYPFARIDTILIDETAAGRLVAEAVSINGWVRTAVSSVQLQHNVTSSRAASLANMMVELEKQRLALATDLAATADAGVPTLLTVTSPLRITAASLRSEIAPLLQGIEEIQQVCNALRSEPYSGQISAISQSSPVSISLSGLRDAVTVVLDTVIPWRRRHAERMARLHEEDVEIENRRRTAQLEHDYAKIEQVKIENQQAQLEVERAKIELERDRLRLAAEIFDCFNPDGDQREELHDVYRHKLLRGIAAVVETSIEFVASGPGFEEDRNRTTWHGTRDPRRRR